MPTFVIIYILALNSLRKILRPHLQISLVDDIQLQDYTQEWVYIFLGKIRLHPRWEKTVNFILSGWFLRNECIGTHYLLIFLFQGDQQKLLCFLEKGCLHLIRWIDCFRHLRAPFSLCCPLLRLMFSFWCIVVYLRSICCYVIAQMWIFWLTFLLE